MGVPKRVADVIPGAEIRYYPDTRGLRGQAGAPHCHAVSAEG